MVHCDTVHPLSLRHQARCLLLWAQLCIGEPRPSSGTLLALDLQPPPATLGTVVASDSITALVSPTPFWQLCRCKALPIATWFSRNCPYLGAKVSATFGFKLPCVTKLIGKGPWGPQALKSEFRACSPGEVLPAPQPPVFAAPRFPFGGV